MARKKPFAKIIFLRPLFAISSMHSSHVSNVCSRVPLWRHEQANRFLMTAKTDLNTSWRHMESQSVSSERSDHRQQLQINMLVFWNLSRVSDRFSRHGKRIELFVEVKGRKQDLFTTRIFNIVNYSSQSWSNQLPCDSSAVFSRQRQFITNNNQALHLSYNYSRTSLLRTPKGCP